MNSKRLALLVGYYDDPSPERAAEFLACVRRNVSNVEIDEIHVFDETTERKTRSHEVFLDPKVTVVHHGKRMRFCDFFEYADRVLAGNLVIIANTDIYFDDTLALLRSVPLDGKLLALTRWDVGKDGYSVFLNQDDSQDAWIFVPPMPAFLCDWYLGILGCDDRLANEATKAGIAVTNPSLSIRAHHLHTSKVRRYNPVVPVPGEYLQVPATDITGAMRRVNASGELSRQPALERTRRPYLAIAASVAAGLTLGVGLTAAAWRFTQRRGE